MTAAGAQTSIVMLVLSSISEGRNQKRN